MRRNCSGTLLCVRDKLPSEPRKCTCSPLASSSNPNAKTIFRAGLNLAEIRSSTVALDHVQKWWRMSVGVKTYSNPISPPLSSELPRPQILSPEIHSSVLCHRAPNTAYHRSVQSKGGISIYPPYRGSQARHLWN